jgi:hypothetical protein
MRGLFEGGGEFEGVSEKTRNPGRGVAAPTVICYSIVLYIFYYRKTYFRFFLEELWDSE